MQCDICLEFEYEDDDLMVICEMCNVAVHQSCNGGDIMDRVPAGEWYCDRCKVLKAQPTLKCDAIKCFLCDELQGAMRMVDQKNGIWAHIICVNWTPEIWFNDDKRT